MKATGTWTRPAAARTWTGRVTLRVEPLDDPEAAAAYWIERFGPCEIRPGAVSRDGYGTVGKRLAHRVAWEAVNGPIPDRLTIDHRCRTRSCQNVRHMELVTSRENVLRGVSPPAVNARKTRCIRGHPFGVENTSRPPSGGRYCRICNRLAARAARARRRRDAACHDASTLPTR